MSQKNNKELDPSFLTTFLVPKDILVPGICKRSFQKSRKTIACLRGSIPRKAHDAGPVCCSAWFGGAVIGH